MDIRHYKVFLANKVAYRGRGYIWEPFWQAIRVNRLWWNKTWEIKSKNSEWFSSLKLIRTDFKHRLAKRDRFLGFFIGEISLRVRVGAMAQKTQNKLLDYLKFRTKKQCFKSNQGGDASRKNRRLCNYRWPLFNKRPKTELERL